MHSITTRSMRGAFAATAAVFAALGSACTIPTTPLSNTITEGFRIQVQNASVPQVHNKYMNLLEAGGGDHHLFIGPVGTPTYDLTLVDGVITSVRLGIRAVIGGEYSEIDKTTKLFTTGRGDPRAIFQPTYACNPDTDALQVELSFVGWQNHPPGGWVCVRGAFDGGHEFRYSPPGNPYVDPNRECFKVTLVALVSGSVGTATTSSATTVPSSTFTTVTTSSPTTAPTGSVSTSTRTSSPTSTTPTSTPTSSPVPFTDLTAVGFSFRGCAPEERRASDGPGRTLAAALYAVDTMTNQKCAAFCATAGYKYAGSEWTRECWCDNTIRPGRVPANTWASLANCNYRCGGDASQFCGGDAWMSLYEACTPGGPCVNAQFV